MLRDTQADICEDTARPLHYMSCQACANFDIVTPDVFSAQSEVIYPTVALIEVVNCPPGYSCQPGQWPVVITITPDRLPPIVIPSGGTVAINGCSGPIVATKSQFQNNLQFAQSIWAQWAAQQAGCDAISQTGVTPIAGTCQLIGNDALTVTCTVQGTPTQVPANTYTQLVCDPNQYAAVKSMLNAYAQFNVCPIGNAAISGTMTCPTAAGISATDTIPADTFTSSNNGDQALVDRLAQQALTTKLSQDLVALGCSCPVTVANDLISTNCAVTFQLQTTGGVLIPPPNQFVINQSNFDICAAYFGATASCIPKPTVVVPLTYSGPNFQISGVCPPNCP